MKDEITREERVDNLKGMGCSRKRVEDARFTQGKGNYVDDIKLDGMPLRLSTRSSRVISSFILRPPWLHSSGPQPPEWISQCSGSLCTGKDCQPCQSGFPLRLGLESPQAA